MKYVQSIPYYTDLMYRANNPITGEGFIHTLHPYSNNVSTAKAVLVSNPVDNTYRWETNLTDGELQGIQAWQDSGGKYPTISQLGTWGGIGAPTNFAIKETAELPQRMNLMKFVEGAHNKWVTNDSVDAAIGGGIGETLVAPETTQSAATGVQLSSKKTEPEKTAAEKYGPYVLAGIIAVIIIVLLII